MIYFLIPIYSEKQNLPEYLTKVLWDGKTIVWHSKKRIGESRMKKMDTSIAHVKQLF